MKFSQRKLATLVSVTAVAGVMALLPGTAAFAVSTGGSAPAAAHHVSLVAPSQTFTPSTALVSANAQAADEQTVVAFAASHALPVLPTSHTAAQYSAFKSALTAYWTATPWSALAGQWGCTVQSVTVTQDADASGDITPTLSEETNCGSNLQAADLLATSAVVTRTSALKTLSTTSVSSAPSPDTTVSGCGSTGYVNNCITAVIGSTIKAASTWSSEEQTTGHVRLGEGAGSGSTCSTGTLLGTSATQVMGYGSTVSVTKPMTVDSNWSARFYNPNFYGGYCKTA
jgi:hypothetical protein